MSSTRSDEAVSVTAWIGWLPLALLPMVTLSVGQRLPPWGFMWSLAGSVYLGLKWLSWWRVRGKVAHASWRSAAYLLAWPGMDAKSFLDASKRAGHPVLERWIWALAKIGAGAVLFWSVARRLPLIPLLAGWAGMVGLVLMLHFGSFEMMALFWQRMGVSALPIMADPLRCESLGDFWGKRWNLGFRQLAYDLIFRPLHRSSSARWAAFLVFLASGIIHDLVISVPAHGGYGLPTMYFLLQGAGVAVERSSLGGRVGLGGGLRGRIFAVLVSAGPVGLLFHKPFVLRVMVPFMRALHAL